MWSIGEIKSPCNHPRKLSQPRQFHGESSWEELPEVTAFTSRQRTMNETWINFGGVTNESLLTREEYEDLCSEPQYYNSLYGLVGTVFQSLIFLVGITGNMMVVVTVKVSKSLHTTTNIYLMSLAVADIITLLSSVPQVRPLFSFHYSNSPW